MKTIIPSLIYEFEPSPRGRLALALVGFLFAVLLFFLDYKTGIELDFSVFFMVPILLMSWLLGFKTGLLFALLGETFDVIANILAGKVYSHPAIFYWDVIQDLVVYLIFVAAISRLRILIKYLRNANRRQAQMNTALQEADEMKTEILRIVSHDLKNPLIGIQGLSRRISEKGSQLPDQDLKSFGGTILRAADKMFHLIENLLDADKYENGLGMLSKTEFNVAVVVENIIQKHKHHARDKDLTIHKPTQNPVTICSDREFTEQIFDNLISNAIKYTPNGRNIYINLLEEDEDILFQVKDEGPGIREEEREMLFKKFSRLSSVATANEHSSGLGLYIVKKLVEALNGDVWCESSTSSGAKFVVRLPREIESENGYGHEGKESVDQSTRKNGIQIG